MDLIYECPHVRTWGVAKLMFNEVITTIQIKSKHTTAQSVLN